MFKLTGISATGYRSFSQPLELELRPLTLLYGRNNAGKSAVLRLLPILADSVADGAASPFEIARVAGPGASFLDVVDQHSPLKRVSLRLSWTDSDGAVWADEFQLKYLDEVDAVVVMALTLIDPNDQVYFKAEVEPYPDQARYSLSLPTAGPTTITPNFAGLVPAPDSDLSALQRLRERLLGLRRNIQWLQSVRARWDRLVTKTGSRHRMLGADGGNAAEVLITDERVFTEVAGWYAGPDIERRLEAPEFVSRQHRLLLSPQTSPLRIDLLDTGEGMIQVLPVLVACALARERGNGAILAIEEPESHLHGNAQQALAVHLCDLAAGNDPPTIIAETHSRILLLGIQLAIAEDRLPPERFCAYWIDQELSGESIATKVEFDRHGSPKGGWPGAAFAEDQALARRLLDKQLQGGAFN